VQSTPSSLRDLGSTYARFKRGRAMTARIAKTDNNRCPLHILLDLSCRSNLRRRSPRNQSIKPSSIVKSTIPSGPPRSIMSPEWRLPPIPP